MTMKKSDFYKKTSVEIPLVNALISQCGGWKEFTEIAKDVSIHGFNCGYSGFISHNEVDKLFRKHTMTILETFAERNDGCTIIDYVKRYTDLSEIEIMHSIFANSDKRDSSVGYWLTGFVFETLCYDYVSSI